MLTQQQLEIKNIEQGIQTSPYQGPPPQVLQYLPPHQQQMCQASQAFQGAGYGGPAPAANPMAMQQGVPAMPQQQAMPVQPAGAPLVAQGRTVMLAVPQGMVLATWLLSTIQIPAQRNKHPFLQGLALVNNLRLHAEAVGLVKGLQ